MSRVRLPLYGKILSWFALNLAVLALLFFFFLKAQFRLGLDWMLSGEPGDRIAAIGETITFEFSRLAESEWPAHLSDYDQKHDVTFGLFDGRGEQLHGKPLTPPPEVMPRLIDRRPLGEKLARRAPGPVSKRPADAPPKPRFMMRAGDPARYWAGVHLDLVAQDGRSLTLVMVSESISGGGLFFDLRPWLWLAAAALLISALMWMPFVRGITGFIGTLNHAAGRIAHGKFDERIEKQRSDELGELSTSVNTMAAQLGDYMREQNASPPMSHTSYAAPSPACRWRSAWWSSAARPINPPTCKNSTASSSTWPNSSKRSSPSPKPKPSLTAKRPKTSICANCSKTSSPAKRPKTASNSRSATSSSTACKTPWIAASATSCATPSATLKTSKSPPTLKTAT
ncbi:MAG: HAMP domain-containing protein [Verrucomicrobiaceae bacterium]|nr:HAMP domain-containing protein [Verrucomicrobiaceae bacterium]